MKKRKSPILLITCLVLFAGVAFAFQYAATASQNPSKPEQPSAPVQVGDTRPQTSQRNVASMVRQQGNVSNQPAHGSPEAMMAKKMGMGMGGRASIAVPNPSSFKPKPNDSAPSTQWYTTEARKPQ